MPDLRKSLRNFYRRHSDLVFDVILFGSAVKGKDRVDDVDVAVIFVDRVDTAILLEIPYHADYLRLTELYEQKLWKTLFSEGVSAIHGKRLSATLGVRSYGLFTYDIRHLGSRKSRFSQVLAGYKSQSMLKRAHAELLRPGAVLVPVEYVELFRSFLEMWSAKYEMKWVWVREE